MENIEAANGFLLVNKRYKMTSHDVVARLRRITKIKKIGHAGTLDPLASGLLIVAVGRLATKQIDRYIKLDKTYEAEIFLGAVSNTYDLEGEVKETGASPLPLEVIAEKIKNFVGEQEQIPPMHSAKKVDGKRLYELARRGEEIERKPIKINIYSLEILSYEWPVLTISVQVSSGTYIRTLANDIGQALGVGGYLKNLKRTSIGEFELSNARGLEELKEGWEKYLFAINN